MIRTKVNNRKGTVLVWAVVVLLLLTILIGSVLTLAMSYYNRSVNSNSATQAHYTALSAVNSISDLLCSSGSSGRDTVLSKLSSDGTELDLAHLQFASKPGMENCSAIIKRETYSGTDTLLITATAVVGNQTKAVSLRLCQSYSFPPADGTVQYINADDSYQIYGNPNKYFYVRSGATLEFMNNADYTGKIYAEPNSNISIVNGSKFESSGELYLQSGVSITYSKLHNQFVGKIYAKSGSVITINDIQVTVTINSNNTISFSPPNTGLEILQFFKVNDWNSVSGSSSGSSSGGGGSSQTSQLSGWSPMQYEPA